MRNGRGGLEPRERQIGAGVERPVAPLTQAQPTIAPISSVIVPMIATTSRPVTDWS